MWRSAWEHRRAVGGTARLLCARQCADAMSRQGSDTEISHIMIPGATVAPFSNRALVQQRTRLQTAQPWHPASGIMCILIETPRQRPGPPGIGGGPRPGGPVLTSTRIGWRRATPPIPGYTRDSARRASSPGEWAVWLFSLCTLHSPLIPGPPSQTGTPLPARWSSCGGLSGPCRAPAGPWPGPGAGLPWPA